MIDKPVSQHVRQLADLAHGRTQVVGGHRDKLFDLGFYLLTIGILKNPIFAQGFMNGALGAGRTRSSFVFTPSWRERPWPPKAKYGASVSDEALGLIGRGDSSDAI